MTQLRKQPTVGSTLADHQRRIRRLEAHPSGGAGDCSCQCIEPDHNRDLPFDLGNYIGPAGYGYAGRINETVVDTGCITNGYIESASPAVDDVTPWTVWLGPTGARFRLNITSLMDSSSGRLALAAERMVETDGLWEPESAADPIDLFGGHFCDLYSGAGTLKNVWNASYTFGIGGADCDTAFTSVDDSAPYGYELNGGPSFYRLWLYVSGKNAASSGFAARLQSAWLKRVTGDEP